MATTLNSEETYKLANNFYDLTFSMTNYLVTNWNNPQLSISDRDKLIENIKMISSNSQKMLAQTTILEVENSKKSLADIEKATSDIKVVLVAIANIQKAINISAMVVTLGAAILTKNPEAIIGAVKGLQKAVIA